MKNLEQNLSEALFAKLGLACVSPEDIADPGDQRIAILTARTDQSGDEVIDVEVVSADIRDGLKTMRDVSKFLSGNAFPLTAGDALKIYATKTSFEPADSVLPSRWHSTYRAAPVAA